MTFFRQDFFQFYFLLILYFTASSPLLAQEDIYQWSNKKDIPLLGIGAAGTATSLLMRAQNTPLDLGEINDLNTDQIMRLDEHTNENYSLPLQNASDILLYTSYAFPLSTLLIPEARQDVGMIALMLTEGVLVNEMLTGITKNLVNRPRPFTYNTNLSDEVRTEDGNNLSFFSGHTSYTALLSFFSAQVLNTYVEKPLSRKMIWAGAILWPAATGYFRYAGGKHFITDVMVGYAVGAAIGYLIPKLHDTEQANKNPKGFYLDKEASQPFRLVFLIN